MLVSFCGCGKQEDAPAPRTALSMFYQTILDVQAVADIFQARIDLGSDNTNYPESAAGWKLYAQVQVCGNYVCMIVLPGGYVVPENVFAS